MWSTTIDPDLRMLPPTGLPLAIIIISCVFLVFSVICVGLRTRIRLVERTFGLDDGLMAAGTVWDISKEVRRESERVKAYDG